MNADLATKVKARRIVAVEPISREYSVTIDGVVEIEKEFDDKVFFDGLFETILEYIEKHNASAGLSISHRLYEESNENGVVNDREIA